MRIRRPRLSGLWRHPDFVKLWAGQTISVFGSLVGRTALPFTAILALDASAFQVAVLALADLVPGLLFGLIAGVWVDRLRRRPIMIAADVGRALLLATIPLAWALGGLHIEQLYVVALCVGLLTVCFDVAYLSYLPSLVDREQLVEGNSKLSASASAAEIGAFGIAGWLVQLLNGPLTILIDAISFVVSAASVGAIRASEPAPPPVEDRLSARQEIADGVRQISGDSVLRPLALTNIMIQFAFRMFGTVFLLFVVRDLGFKPGVLGVIFAVGGGSSLVAAGVAGNIVRRIGVGPTMILGVATTAAGGLCIPVAPHAGVVAALLLIAGQLITDPGFVLYEINDVSLRQSVTPERMLGRVNGTIRFGQFAAMIGGTLLAGLLGETVGLRATLFVGVGVMFAASLPLLVSPVRRLVHVPVVTHDVALEPVAEGG